MEMYFCPGREIGVQMKTVLATVGYCICYLGVKLHGD